MSSTEQAISQSVACLTDVVDRKELRLKLLIVGATGGIRRELVRRVPESEERRQKMTLKAARLANLFLTGVLTGNEFSGFIGFHPALYRLPTDSHASAEQAITARFGK